MADSFNDEMIEDALAPSSTAAQDVEMGEGGETSATASGSAAGGTGAVNPSADLPFAEGGPEDDRVQEKPPPRVSFSQYLATPIVTLLVGSGDKETILTAHQGLLVKSPFFAEACASFADDGSVSVAPNAVRTRACRSELDEC